MHPTECPRASESSSALHHLIVPALVAFFGCDPGIRVTGTVLRKDGRPASDASVTLVCPDKGARGRLHAHGDSSGRFELRSLGCLERRCVLEASEGEATAKVPVGSVCQETVALCSEQQHCNQADATLVLDSP